MSKVGYLIKCVVNMDYSKMFKSVKRIKQKSGKSTLGIYFDIFASGIKYGAGYSDYELFEWWDLNKEQRNSFLTRQKNNALIRRMNNAEYYHILDNKHEFNELFPEWIGRKWLLTQNASYEQFVEFMEGLRFIMIKPINECCGKGVQKIDRESYKDLKEMYDYIIQSGSPLCEEYVIQHPEMSRMYPHSVNTVRMVTILDDKGESHILYASMRMGNDGRVVDNLNGGGICAPVDLETGELSRTAFDKNYNYHEKHPYTGVPIVGFKIPNWENAKDFVLEAAKKIPQLRYIGWDVVIKEDGPMLIEANQYPSHDLIQPPHRVPNRMGILPKLREFIDI